MTVHLLSVMASSPYLVLASVFAVAYALVCAAVAFEINEPARELVADVRLAMKRADLSLDYVARCTSVPVQRLSDQLNAKTPFTSFWRFVAPEIKASRFWDELFAIRAERHGGIYVRGELAALVRGVEQLVIQRKERAS